MWCTRAVQKETELFKFKLIAVLTTYSDLSPSKYSQFCICLAALWMFEAITYSLHQYIYRNFLNKCISGTVRNCVLQCDPSKFNRKRICHSMIFPSLRPVTNSLKEVGSIGLEIAKQCVSFLYIWPLDQDSLLIVTLISNLISSFRVKTELLTVYTCFLY